MPTSSRDTRPGERGQGRECARAPVRRCRLTAGGGPSRSAVRPLHLPFPLGRVGSPPGLTLTPSAGWPPPARGLHRQSKPPPRPPGAEAKTPTARCAATAASSRVAPDKPPRASRCRARTRAPNKERRGTRPPHTRPPHFRRAGVSKFFPWAAAPRPPARPRSSPPPPQHHAKFRRLAA